MRNPFVRLRSGFARRFLSYSPGTFCHLTSMRLKPDHSFNPYLVGAAGSVDRQLHGLALRQHLGQLEREHAVVQLGFALGPVDVLRQFVGCLVLVLGRAG